MTLDEKIPDEIAGCAPHFDRIPAAVMIHNVRDLNIVYMSPIGLKILGVTMQELTDMGFDWYARFFNQEEAKSFLPDIFDLLERNNDDEVATFFQQMRSATDPEWRTYLFSTKIFMHGDDNKPLLTITTFTPFDTHHDEVSNNKEQRLQDGNYLKEKKPLFDSLTRREREIIQLMAKGMNSAEIAAAYYCSIDTVKTHRRNIKRKLEIESNYDIFRLAHAFGLV